MACGLGEMRAVHSLCRLFADTLIMRWFVMVYVLENITKGMQNVQQKNKRVDDEHGILYILLFGDHRAMAITW